MRAQNSIRNSKDLKLEIARLTRVKREQEAYLKDQYFLLKNKINTPVRVFNNIFSYVPGADFAKGIFSFRASQRSEKESDWLTKGLRLGVPLFLNKTLLRKSGWIKKALVLLASEGIIGQVNRNKISNLIDNITGFIKPQKKKKRKKNLDPTYSDFEDTPLVNTTIHEERQ